MSTLERAIAIAVDAHTEMVDKANAPYILHPLRVMLSVSDNDARIVAALHDVVEDCDEWSFERLLDEGFSERIIKAIASVTKIEGEGYDDFIEMAGKDPIGRIVKLADLKDNMDLSRISVPAERDFNRIEKYKRATKNLLSMEV